MGTKDKEEERPTDSAAASASAARGGDLRRRRPSRRSSRVEPAESSAPATKSGKPLSSRIAKDSDDGESSSASTKLERERGGFEATSASHQPQGAPTPPASDESSSDEEGSEKAAHAESSGKDVDSPSTSSYQPTSSRLLIEVTPRIQKFLETHVPHKKRKALNVQDRIDLDVLQNLAANKKKPHPRINMADLVEDSQVVERIDPPKISLESLSFSERLRLMAEERRHQAAVRSLWKESPDRQDTFADLNKSLA
ncbi:hypothetical protein Emed_004474 [Eimeria media]